MTTHYLKSWPEFFQPVYDGIKNFELRRNDRHYEVGDYLVLQEFIPGIHNTNEGEFTGRECTVQVVYMLNGAGNVGTILPIRGLSQGFTIMSIRK